MGSLVRPPVPASGTTAAFAGPRRPPECALLQARTKTWASMRAPCAPLQRRPGTPLLTSACSRSCVLGQSLPRCEPHMILFRDAVACASPHGATPPRCTADQPSTAQRRDVPRETPMPRYTRATPGWGPGPARPRKGVRPGSSPSRWCAKEQGPSPVRQREEMGLGPTEERRQEMDPGREMGLQPKAHSRHTHEGMSPHVAQGWEVLMGGAPMVHRGISSEGGGAEPKSAPYYPQPLPPYLDSSKKASAFRRSYGNDPNLVQPQIRRRGGQGRGQQPRRFTDEYGVPGVHQENGYPGGRPEAGAEVEWSRARQIGGNTTPQMPGAFDRWGPHSDSGEQTGGAPQVRSEGERVERTPSQAELVLPPELLRRLRRELGQVATRVKVGRRGVTLGIAEHIRAQWRTQEVVKVRCEGEAAANMKRTHEDLERLTGGLVIWRAGGSAAVYRGMDYSPSDPGPCAAGPVVAPRPSPSIDSLRTVRGPVEGLSIFGVSEYLPTASAPAAPEGREDAGAFPETAGESAPAATTDLSPLASPSPSSAGELGTLRAPTTSDFGTPPAPVFSAATSPPPVADALEDVTAGLGPKVSESDWDGRGAFPPVDADKLLASGLRVCKPFRMLPFGVSPKLSDLELTELRHRARKMGPHFLLGKSRDLDGLAMAILQLWQRTDIAKIGLRPRVQNLTNENVANQLRALTDGVLLSRDKTYVVLFRGKDFLPGAVASALEQQKAQAQAGADEEEQLRLLSSPGIMLPPEVAHALEQSRGGMSTPRSPQQLRRLWREWTEQSAELQKITAQAQAQKKMALARQIERKIELARRRKESAEQDLLKLRALLKPATQAEDRESITPEERYMYTKLGRKMRAELELGKRGVFSGTVENMHLHWKHRDLVKVICKEKDRSVVDDVADELESASGGIWVATIPVKKTHAIIFYRGKNYTRPAQLRPSGMLSKRQALQRALEMQRKKSLEQHLEQLEKNISELQSSLIEAEGDAQELGRRHGLPEHSLEVQAEEGEEGEGGKATYPGGEEVEESENGQVVENGLEGDALRYGEPFGEERQEQVKDEEDTWLEGEDDTRLEDDDDTCQQDRGLRETVSARIAQGHRTGVGEAQELGPVLGPVLSEIIEHAPGAGAGMGTLAFTEEADEGAAPKALEPPPAMPPPGMPLPAVAPTGMSFLDEDAVQVRLQAEAEARDRAKQARKEQTAAEVQAAALGVGLVEGEGQPREELSKRERLLLRRAALRLDSSAVFQVGKGNVLEGVGSALRLFFRKHPLAKVGLGARAEGTPVPEIVRQLEALTGGVVVSVEESRVILYRGWLSAHERAQLLLNQDSAWAPQSPEVERELWEAMRAEDEGSIAEEDDIDSTSTSEKASLL